jgi:hypothetical protein
VFSCKIAISHVPQFPSEIVFAKWCSPDPIRWNRPSDYSG